jgi:sugar lactone lactonase YvrE
MERVRNGSVLSEGHHLPEGIRWHGGRVWFSDIFSGRVKVMDVAGHVDVVTTLEDDDPSGLGFLPDGSLLMACMRTRTVRRVTENSVAVFADLQDMPGHFLNDMVTDGDGDSFLDAAAARHFGRLGNDYIILVRADGSSKLAAMCDETFPNGLAITPDGSTLLMGCTFSQEIRAMDIGRDKKLTNPRTWAVTAPAGPDGICIDAEGAVWFAAPAQREFRRVKEGGEVLEVIRSGNFQAIAPVLGGSDRKTLFGATSDISGYNEAATTWPGYASGPGPSPTGEVFSSQRDRSFGTVGTVIASEVSVPGVGWP